MPLTALPIISVKGPYITGQPSANDLDLTFTAGDPSNGNSFASTGKEVLLVQNAHASAAKTFSAISVADNRGRTQDITDYSLAAGEIGAFQFTQQDGWTNSDGVIELDCEDNNIKFCVLRYA